MTRQRTLRTLRLLLCLLLAVAACTLGGLSVRRKVSAFQPLGFAATPAGALVRVGRVDDPAAGVAPGDEILLVDGAEVGGVDALSQRLRGRPSAELAVLRGGQVVRTPYHRPPLAPDLPYLILVLIGSAYLLIGLYTLIRQQTHESFLFCLWCLTSALLYLVSPAAPLDAEYRLAYFADQLARCLLPALTLHLFLIFPSNRTAAAGPRRLLAFLYLPGAVLLALQLDLMLANGRWLFGRPTAASLQALDRIDLVHLVAFSLAAVAVLIYRLLRERVWEQRRQLHWMILGLAGGYLPFLLLYVAPFVLGLHLPQLLAAAAVLPLALVPLSFAYAILLYKLWDIEVIARDVVSATVTLLLGVLGFSLVNLAITRGVPGDLPLARNLLLFVAGLGIAGLLVPTRQSLSAALERLQYRGTFGKRRALLGLGRDLLHERDLGRLSGALLERLVGGMDLERASLYLVRGDALVAIDAIDATVRGDADAFHAPAGTLRDLDATGAVSTAHLAARAGFVRRAARPRTVTTAPPVLSALALDPAVWRDGGAYRLPGTELPSGAPSPVQALFIAGYRYAFPLTVRGRGIGLVLAGFKRDQAPLNSEDVELVRHLLNQAALAIENAQLLGQLHLQLQEVQRLQTYSDGIFESSPAGIAVLDGQQRLVSANPAFAALVGRDRGELIGLGIAEVLPVKPLPLPGEGPIEVSYRDRAPRGLSGHAAGAEAGAGPRERCLQMSLADLAPSCTPQREALSVLVVYDVSERVAMERALKEKDRLAALGMLAAGVAHEVNTPITGISSYAQMLLSDTAPSDPRYPILKKVERQTFRAARIVNNLLELARDRQRDRQPVVLLPLLRESIDLLAERLESGRIELAWNVPPAGDSLQVLGSDGELQQVFTNLFANALDAMASQPRGRLGITLAATAGSVTVSIEDTGQGIPPDRLEAVFQPFYSTKLHRGGTGLGLGISRDIVHRHGGRLAVESPPGAGACFTVVLPLLSVHPQDDPARAAGAAAPP
jgi:two-component system NtrC family sensor kinase